MPTVPEIMTAQRLKLRNEIIAESRSNPEEKKSKAQSGVKIARVDERQDSIACKWCLLFEEI